MEMTRMARFKTNVEQLIREKSARDRRKITQEIVAKETELSLPTINRWVRGDVARIELETVQALCKYFEVSFSELVQFDPEE